MALKGVCSCYGQAPHSARHSGGLLRKLFGLSVRNCANAVTFFASILVGKKKEVYLFCVCFWLGTGQFFFFFTPGHAPTPLFCIFRPVTRFRRRANTMFCSPNITESTRKRNEKGLLKRLTPLFRPKTSYKTGSIPGFSTDEACCGTHGVGRRTPGQKSRPRGFDFRSIRSKADGGFYSGYVLSLQLPAYKRQGGGLGFYSHQWFCQWRVPPSSTIGSRVLSEAAGG